MGIAREVLELKLAFRSERTRGIEQDGDGTIVY